MFDVPERRRKVRDTLRFLLRNAGFVRFQDSAWVYPYPCNDLVELLRTELASGKGDVRYLEVSFPEADDGVFRKHFDLL
jgi:DNA-binding transcriptional regulator PaaX